MSGVKYFDVQVLEGEPLYELHISSRFKRVITINYNDNA